MLPALLNWLKPVYRMFGQQSNMHQTLNFCPDQWVRQKGIKCTKAKRSYCTKIYTVAQWHATAKYNLVSQ